MLNSKPITTHPKNKPGETLPQLYLGIVDFDSVIYRCSAVHEDDEYGIESAKLTLIDFVQTNIVNATSCTKYLFIVTGPDNFRRDIAVTKAYKGQRAVEKPIHYQELLDYAIERYRCLISDGVEADDYAVNCHQKYQGSSVLLGMDKDNLQSSGWHYNFIKEEAKFITPYEAQWCLSYQMLAGDPGDNIQGLWRIGDKKATDFLIEGNKVGLPPMAVVYKVYTELGMSTEFYEEQYRLLYMLRDEVVNFEADFIKLEAVTEFNEVEGNFIGVNL